MTIGFRDVIAAWLVCFAATGFSYAEVSEPWRIALPKPARRRYTHRPPHCGLQNPHVSGRNFSRLRFDTCDDSID
jgi:hypothetical protein